jgi:hypothetical protein
MPGLTRSTGRFDLGAAACIVGLFLLALVVRLYASAQLPFPATEAAAYYAGVAQHIAQGAGLVSDAVWSYATPPLEAPKPAFELWMPLSSFASAIAMSVLGSHYGAAQVGSALLGALVAPLAWALARAASTAGGLETRRGAAVALATGLLAALFAPFVLTAAVPDSYTPFTVTALAAALLVPAALGMPRRSDETAREPSRWAGFGVGVFLGLCYLARQEAVWLGLVVLVMAVQVGPGEARSRVSGLVGRLWPIVLGGLVMVLPWLARNTMELGSPFPGQTIENLFLRRNEDIFAYAERPSASLYLGQGVATLLGNPLEAAAAAFNDALFFPAFPIGVVGLVSLVGLWRSPTLRRPSALTVLLWSGALTFLATVLLFPVASRWGTYLHASGPLLVGLTAVSALGADALVARFSRWRRWPQVNVIIGPAALVVVAVTMSLLQLGFLGDQTRARQERYEAIASSLSDIAGEAGDAAPATLMTDHPMWLATVTGQPAIALPDEDPSSVLALGERFGTDWLVVIDERGRYPGALLDATGSGCLAADPQALGVDGDPARLFRLADGCAA